MRILKLECENINSLAGSWTIDFTHPDYAKNHDIFVIHGPTGAGKTTLLDAITLALYGRTPRLEAINNGESGNELMTRGTGFCRAAVTYACKKGIFLSEFQQNRANLKPTGKLQKASYKITKLTNDSFGDADGDIANDRSFIPRSGTGSGLEKETQEIIQLDYKQFCRSIMLAQGEFSAFLESNARERAEILEKLTGTERYRAIGKKIAEEFSEIKKNFQRSKERKEDVEKSLLSEEEEKTTRKRQTELEEKNKSLEDKLTQIQKELAYFEELDRLQKDFQAAESEMERIASEKKVFALQEESLTLAEAARQCESEYMTLLNLRNGQQSDRNLFSSLSDQLAAAETLFAQAKEKAEKSKAQVQAEEEDRSLQEKTWNTVRKLDVEIAAANKSLQDEETRRTNAEKQAEESRSKVQGLKKDCQALEASIDTFKKYLSAHKNDEKLSAAITKAETLKESLTEQIRLAKQYEKDAAGLSESKKNYEEKIDLLQSQLNAIDEEIRQFVSADALLIATMLRRELKKGKPCPVCGSVYHTSHKKVLQGELDFSEAEENDAGKKEGSLTESENPLTGGKEESIRERSGSLTTKRDTIEQELQSLQQKVISAKNDLKNTVENEQKARSACTNTLGQISQIFEAWKDSLTEPLTEDKLDSLLDSLRLQQKKWEKTDKDLKEAESDYNAKSAEMRTLSENLVLQEKNLTQIQEDYKKANEGFLKLTKDREELFGQKSPDEEAAKKEKVISSLKEEADEAEKSQQTAQEKRTSLDAKKIQVQENIKARAPQLQSAEDAFVKKYQANGFDSEEAFSAARMSDEDFASLAKKREELKTAETKAESALSHAEKSYEDYKKTVSLSRTKDAVLAEESALSKDRELTGKELQEISATLIANMQNQDKLKSILEEYTKLQAEYDTWEQMNKWAGMREGADLSVFVQSLAFNSLLALANKNLYGITNRYKVVQKAPASLEFDIQDIYFAEARSIANLSGGERFLVSLSFALGISEFASRNVRVDSLFLDEGFGTLSGELLTEAINALKNLQKDGKMLGIITHVQDVINEIDQRIEVKPVSGGHSELIGSGISTGHLF